MKRIANYLILFVLILQGAGLVFATSATDDEKSAERFGISTETVRQIRESQGLSSESLQKFPNQKLPNLIRRLQHPDLPYERAKFRLLQQRDENGRVNPTALGDALQRLRELRKGSQKATVAGLPTGKAVDLKTLLPPGTRDGQGWKSLGPNNFGGRTRSIILHPNDPLHFWLGSVGGGVWQTFDGGQNFEAVDDRMANLSVSCMVMDPTNPKIIYAGTGEGFPPGEALSGAGIFRTKDGHNWDQIMRTRKGDFMYVNRLAISADGKVLLAATSTLNSGGAIFRSDDGERLKWENTTTGPFVDVLFHPTDSRRALSATCDGRVYYSDNGGEVWKPVRHDLVWKGRVELAYCRKNPTIVYASVDNNDGEVWRSKDDGKTFIRMASQTQSGELAHYLGKLNGGYANCIWAGDPTNEDFVIVGGLDLFRSTDGGRTLDNFSQWWNSASAHADHHAIVASPGFNGTTDKTVFFGNDGGIYKTDDVYTVGSDPDRQTGWQNLNNAYVATQFYGAAANGSGMIIAGAQDNGTLLYSPEKGSEEWRVISEGDGGFCATGSSNPNEPGNSSVFYGEYIFGNVHRNTTDGGKDSESISGAIWNGATTCWKPVPYSITDVQHEESLFIAPLIVDPNDAKRLLVGCRSLWQTRNGTAELTETSGPKWEEIKGPLNPSEGFISAIAIAPGEPDVIWVGYQTGKIFKISHGRATSPDWNQVASVPGILPRRFCTRLVIEPTDHQVVYATFGSFHRQNVWKTDNGGQRWLPLGGDTVPKIPVYALAIHPARSEWLYIGTEIGVFASENGGKSWLAGSQGPTNCAVDDLFWIGQTLVAATYGRGIFAIDLSNIH
jgi:photosystem II stability/assembly factor-like uncharacterized protein